MPRVGWNSILRQVRRIGMPENGGDLSDGTLLRRFVANRDETAFAALVARHGPMVWALCRRLLHDLPDAEDAFQATFLVLVRKAGAIRRPELLGGWLHGVAYRVANRLRAAKPHRHTTSQADFTDVRANESLPEAERKELRLLLDEEVRRLPERYRVPFVLCHLEGLTNEEAARRLRCPKGTVLSRLSRARERLRRRLTQRGVGLSVAAIAAALTEPVDAAPLPPGLSAATTNLASAVASGAASAASQSTALALMEGVVTSMFVAKLKIAAAILLTLGLVGAGGSMLAKSGDSRIQAQATVAQAAVRDGLIAAKAEAKAREADPPPAATSKRKDLEIRDTLARVTRFDGIDDPKMTLRDTLDALSAKYGLTFHVDERAFALEKISDVLGREIATPKAVPPMNAPLALILNRIISRLGTESTSGAVYLIRKDHVEITTAQAARSEIGDFRPDAPFLPLVYEHFEDIPLLDALRALADHADINVVINPKTAAYLKDIRVTAPLHNVPAETAVRVLAEMGDLDMVRMGNVYYVASKGDLEGLLKTWPR